MREKEALLRELEGLTDEEKKHLLADRYGLELHIPRNLRIRSKGTERYSA